MLKNFTKKEELAEQVLGYYAKNARSRFMMAFPTVEDLAEADEDILLKQWEGLGYYSRARNLQKAAKTIVEKWNGRLPEEKKDLLTLAGIGDYTAGAIASIAYGKDEVAVDGNFIRVACRLLAYDGNVWNTAGKRLISKFWQIVLPQNQASAFNQGIMDIGATICLPNGEPKCKECPISSLCRSHQQNNPLDYPVKKIKKQRKIEKKTVLLLYKHKQVMIRKRPQKGLLAGLLEFPMIDGEASQAEVLLWLENRGYQLLNIKKGEKAKHIFSHIEWHMSSWEIELDCISVMERAEDMERWVECKLISEITLPTAFKIFRKKVKQKSS